MHSMSRSIKAQSIHIHLYSMPFRTSTISIFFILRENMKLTSTDTVITKNAEIMYVDGAK